MIFPASQNKEKPLVQTHYIIPKATHHRKHVYLGTTFSSLFRHSIVTSPIYFRTHISRHRPYLTTFGNMFPFKGQFVLFPNIEWAHLCIVICDSLGNARLSPPACLCPPVPVR